MAKPFSMLPQILTKRKNEFMLGVNRVSQDAARAAGAAAVDSTRVDTGLARSNWTATISAPSTAVRPPYAAGSKLGIGEQGNRIGALSQHRAVAAGWNAIRGGPMFIANNVPYIGFLNFGGRNVAPGNMLALARQAWALRIKTLQARILR